MYDKSCMRGSCIVDDWSLRDDLRPSTNFIAYAWVLPVKDEKNTRGCICSIGDSEGANCLRLSDRITFFGTKRGLLKACAGTSTRASPEESCNFSSSWAPWIFPGRDCCSFSFGHVVFSTIGERGRGEPDKRCFPNFRRNDSRSIRVETKQIKRMNRRWSCHAVNMPTMGS